MCRSSFSHRLSKIFLLDIFHSLTILATTMSALAHMWCLHRANPPPPTISHNLWTTRSLRSSGLPVELYSSMRYLRIHRARSFAPDCASGPRKSWKVSRLDCRLGVPFHLYTLYYVHILLKLECLGSVDTKNTCVQATAKTSET